MREDFQNPFKPAVKLCSDSKAFESISWFVRSGQTMILIDKTSPDSCYLDWTSSVMLVRVVNFCRNKNITLRKCSLQEARCDLIFNEANKQIVLSIKSHYQPCKVQGIPLMLRSSHVSLTTTAERLRDQVQFISQT